jgi:hypothetical protein
MLVVIYSHLTQQDRYNLRTFWWPEKMNARHHTRSEHSNVVSRSSSIVLSVRLGALCKFVPQLNLDLADTNKFCFVDFHAFRWWKLAQFELIERKLFLNSFILTWFSDPSIKWKLRTCKRIRWLFWNRRRTSLSSAFRRFIDSITHKHLVIMTDLFSLWRLCP